MMRIVTSAALLGAAAGTCSLEQKWAAVDKTQACDPALSGCHPCGDRASYEQSAEHKSRADALAFVAAQFPLACDACCQNSDWGSVAAAQACKQPDGCHSCDDRANWLEQNPDGYSKKYGAHQAWWQAAARDQVAREFPDQCNPCRAAPPPTTTTTTTTTTCPECTWDDVKDNAACNDKLDGCHPCHDRMQWLVDNERMSEADAIRKVGEEFPGVCSCESGSATTATTTPGAATHTPSGGGGGSEPNPPQWPEHSVKVFRASDSHSTIQGEVDGIHNEMVHSEFGTHRYALLFEPGSYDVSVKVGYYTQVLGLGASPEDVKLKVDCYQSGGSVLTNFWRSAENFHHSSDMTWAVSQAAPVRRVRVDGGISLSQSGYSSGGYLSNSRIGGRVNFGSQQQWFMRNAQLDGGANSGTWNQVFVGCSNAPGAYCGSGRGTVTVADAPVIAEKPFISIGSDGRYFLNVPGVKRDRRGTDFSRGTVIDFKDVFVARADRDSAAAINAKLAAGRHVVFAPGIYNLDAPLKVVRDNQVLLGLGLATLVATTGQQAIAVDNVDGVRIAGLLLQAGAPSSSGATDALLQWGEMAKPAYAGDAANPGFLHDLFARVGGPDNGLVEAYRMVRIRSGHVVGDNLWLWRADHGAGSPANRQCKHGLEVQGDDVTMYGLAVEHTLEDMTLWQGDRGATYFYQSELPYRPVASGHADWASKKYAGYKVTGAAHRAFGVGVYSFFPDTDTEASAGIVATAPDAKFTNAFARYLSGRGGIQHVLEQPAGQFHGRSVHNGGTLQYVCDASRRALRSASR